MLKSILNSLLLISILFASISMAEQMSTPKGLWKTHDDAGKPTGFVRITLHNGVYTGVIEKGLPSQTEPLYCTACKDDRKDQPLIGMVMMQNVKAKGDVYIGDEILDPFSGNTYRVKLTLVDGGNKMKVRGYIGLSLFGRTQLWERMTDE